MSHTFTEYGRAEILQTLNDGRVVVRILSTGAVVTLYPYQVTTYTRDGSKNASRHVRSVPREHVEA